VTRPDHYHGARNEKTDHAVPTLCGVACRAEEAKPSLSEGDSLTEGFGGLNDRRHQAGLDLSLSTTQIYQQNAHGGLSTRRQAGQFSGSHDLEFWANLRELLQVDSGWIYAHIEGSCSPSGHVASPPEKVNELPIFTCVVPPSLIQLYAVPGMEAGG